MRPIRELLAFPAYTALLVAAAPAISAGYPPLVYNPTTGASQKLPTTGTLAIDVPSRTQLAAILSPSNGQIAYLSEAGREGWFKFSPSNNAANITNDPGQCLYDAPASDATGTSGAWFRIGDKGYINVKWCGAKGDTVRRTDGAVSGTSLSSASSSFATTDIGKTILIEKAGAAGTLPFVTTVSAVASSTQITLSGAVTTNIGSGAVFDYGTDDTTAIQRAINLSVNSVGVAKDFFPGGIYLHSNLSLPAYGNPGTGWKTVELAGVAQPATLFGTVQTGALQSQAGSILQTYATSGASLGVTANGGSFSMYHLVVRDLTIRDYDNPQETVLDAGWAAQLSVYNFKCDTGVYNLIASLPTGSSSYCIITPRRGNGALTRLQNVDMGGHYWCLDVNEHTWGDYLNFSSCLHSMVFETADAPSLFGRVAVQESPQAIGVSGAHRFDIQQLMIEHLADSLNTGATAWMAPTEDIRDVGNAANATVKFGLSKGNVGTVDLTNLFWTGGLNIHVSRAGDPEAPSGSRTITGASIPTGLVSATTVPWSGGAGDPGLQINNASVAFTGSINGNELIDTAASSGFLAVGATISAAGLSGSPTITAYGNGSNLPNPTGGVGVYTISGSPQTISSEAMTASNSANLLVCRIPGVYELNLDSNFGVNSAGTVMRLNLNVNGSAAGIDVRAPVASGQPNLLRTHWVGRLNIGDQVTVSAAQDSGGARNLSATLYYRRLAANWN